ncbi:MAG TPA: hypothetical protein VFH90_05410 [Candidatus Limnocylindria bacterium]|nr:hypothetical protein [Candidatus Limnocylindria bacterium]
MPRRTPALLALLAAVVTTACGQPAASTPQASTPQASASASPIVNELATTPDPLPAGTYTRTGFEPRITFALDGSWSGVQLLDGFFDVQQDVATPDVIAVQFGLPSAVYGAGGASVAVTTAAEAAAALAENPALEILGQNGSATGGLEGIAMEIENAGDAHAVVLVVPPGPLGIDPGRRLWIAFLDSADGLVAVMVGGSAAQWDEALAAAEPVLESVRIGP